MTTVLVVVLVLLLIGSLPVYPYSRGWGYLPGSLLAAVLAAVGVMLLR